MVKYISNKISYQEWWRDRLYETTATYREERCQFQADEKHYRVLLCLFVCKQSFLLQKGSIQNGNNRNEIKQKILSVVAAH